MSNSYFHRRAADCWAHLRLWGTSPIPAPEGQKIPAGGKREGARPRSAQPPDRCGDEQAPKGRQKTKDTSFAPPVLLNTQHPVRGLRATGPSPLRACPRLCSQAPSGPGTGFEPVQDDRPLKPVHGQDAHAPRLNLLLQSSGNFQPQLETGPLEACHAAIKKMLGNAIDKGCAAP